MASGNFDPETSAGADGLTSHVFNGSGVWDDCGPEHIPVHFTSAAARDAFAAAVDSAATPTAREAIIKNYLNHAVGGYWGAVSTAL